MQHPQAGETAFPDRVAKDQIKKQKKKRELNQPKGKKNPTKESLVEEKKKEVKSNARKIRFDMNN